MKNTLFIIVVLLTKTCFGQSYFNVISSEQKEKDIKQVITIKKKVSTQKTPEVKKDKFYYTNKIKKNKLALKLLNKDKEFKDSILSKKYKYYNKKILLSKSSKKKDQYLNEVRFLKSKNVKFSQKYSLQKKTINSNIVKYGDTLYLIIKREILLKQANIKKSDVKFLKKSKPPVKGKIVITSPFGERIHPITNKKHFHNGVDLRARNVNVFSVMPGKISKISYSKDLGIYIEVSHENNIKSIYGHLSKILLLENTEINTNTPIAITGNTGSTTAPHLHFIMKKGNKYINPAPILNKQIL